MYVDILGILLKDYFLVFMLNVLFLGKLIRSGKWQSACFKIDDHMNKQLYLSKIKHSLQVQYVAIWKPLQWWVLNFPSIIGYHYYFHHHSKPKMISITTMKTPYIMLLRICSSIKSVEQHMLYFLICRSWTILKGQKYHH